MSASNRSTVVFLAKANNALSTLLYSDPPHKTDIYHEHPATPVVTSSYLLNKPNPPVQAPHSDI